MSRTAARPPARRPNPEPERAGRRSALRRQPLRLPEQPAGVSRRLGVDLHGENLVATQIPEPGVRGVDARALPPRPHPPEHQDPPIVEVDELLRDELDLVPDLLDVLQVLAERLLAVVGRL